MSSRNSVFNNPLIVLLLTLIILLLLLYIAFSNLNSVGQMLKIENFSVKLAENVIDSNQNFWTSYQNQFISFKYPMYLSPFNNLSATELTSKDEQVANYFRLSDSKEPGRSYWIILMAKDPGEKTQNIDVQEWISQNKLNIENADCKTCASHKILPIENFNLGGKIAYSVATPDSKYNIPRTQTIYYQTSYGIASIGFRGWDDSEVLIKDYVIFQRILATLKFL